MTKSHLDTSKPAPTPIEVPRPTRGDVIAYRRSCETEGTGLTHFILVDEKKK